MIGMESVFLIISIAAFILALCSLVACIVIFFKMDVPDAIRFLQHKPIKNSGTGDRKRKAKKSIKRTSRGQGKQNKVTDSESAKQSQAKRVAQSTEEAVQRAEESESNTQILSEKTERPTSLLDAEMSERDTGLLETEETERPTSLLGEVSERPTSLFESDDAERSTRLLEDEGSERETSILEEGQLTDQAGYGAEAVDDEEMAKPISQMFRFEIKKKILQVNTEETIQI